MHIIAIRSITIDYMLVKLLKNRGDQMSTAISVRLPEKLAMDIDEIALETKRGKVVSHSESSGNVYQRICRFTDSSGSIE